MGEDPWVEFGILLLSTETVVGFWGVGLGKGVAAFGAMPGGVVVDFVGIVVGLGLVRPGLDARKVIEGVARGGAGPCRVRGPDAC